MKAKAKKKRTKFVVAWAMYLTNEHKDQLACGAFGKTYSTRKSAYNAIMREIRWDAYAYINETESPNDPITDDQVDEVVCDWVWYKDAWCVKYATTDTEYVVNVNKIEV